MQNEPRLFAEYGFARHHYRLLFCLREDFLAMIDDLRPLMPSIALNRKRLAAINGASALEVVNQAPHLITPDVAERVVRFVAGAEDGRPLAETVVDPALLSVFCSELNIKRRELGEETITSALVEGNREQILRLFYERAVAGISPQLRAFIEDELVLESGSIAV
jgi:hypothetical protein